MSDRELCALIDREARNSIGVEDYFSRDREKALQYYMGEAKGELSPPATEGRSRVVSKTLMDTVEWAMPCLMRMFAQDDMIRFEPDHPDDDQHVEDASDYIAHIFYRKNNGFTTMHDAIKSALLFRMGVIKVYCDKRWEHRESSYEGLSPQEAQALQDDPSIEVTGQEDRGDGTLVVHTRQSEQHREFKCEGVPPEEIRISRDCRSVEDVRFIAHVVQRTRSDLLSEGWPEEELDKLVGDSSAEGDAERFTRHAADGGWTTQMDDGDDSQGMITVTEAYIRVDCDGDGIAEFRRVVKAGKYIHSKDVTDDHPFALFTPILMPYKVIGLSFYDLVEDLQRIFTALDRQLLDNAYLANNPRMGVVENMVNLDDLLNPVIGGMIRMKGEGAVQPIVTPFVGNQILEVRQHFGQVHDTRSGVTEMNSALNSESLAKGNIGSEGVGQLITQGQQRIELVARVFAEVGVKRTWRLLLKLVTQYQDRPSQMKVNGKWLAVDPRAWKNGYDMTVSVGVGTSGRTQKMQGLQMIGQAQMQAHQVGAVSPENAYNLCVDLAKAAGERQTERYFTKPDPNPQPSGPPESVQVEQLRQQGAQTLEQMRQQMTGQLEAMKSQDAAHQREVQAQVTVQVEQAKQESQAQQTQHQNELEAQRDHLKLQNDMALEQFKTEKAMELELAKAHIAQQTAIEVARINAEAKILSAKASGAKDASTADSDAAYQEAHE